MKVQSDKFAIGTMSPWLLGFKRVPWWRRPETWRLAAALVLGIGFVVWLWACVILPGIADWMVGAWPNAS